MSELTREQFNQSTRRYNDRLLLQLDSARRMVIDMQMRVHKHEAGQAVYTDADYIRDLQRLQAVLEQRANPVPVQSEDY